MPKIIWIIAFLVSVPATLLTSFLLLHTFPAPALITPQIGASQVLAASVSDFISVPTSIVNSQVFSADARSLVIQKYLHRYNSPLEPFAPDLVASADSVGLDPFLLVAIAQQESNLCKRIPADSYNCWGYGIYGDKVTRFQSYPVAIATIVKGLKKNYLDKGLNTPEEIMARYTPPSLENGGAWAKGINQFLAEIGE